MLPLGFSFCRRGLSSSVRTVSLTPPGVSTNQGLDALTPYTVTGTINGFDRIEAQCPRAKVFLDMCGFLGDYPASLQVLDVLKHRAKAR